MRFDLSGTATAGGRAERIGHWQMRWQEAGRGTGRSRSGRRSSSVAADRRRRYSRKRLEEAFGRTPAFTAQSTPNLDDWIAPARSAFMPGGMGHHGSVATRTATAWTTSTSRSRRACRTGCFATTATARSATSPSRPAWPCSTARRSRSSSTSTTTATRTCSWSTRGGPLLFTNNGKRHFTSTQGVSAHAPLAGR